MAVWGWIRRFRGSAKAAGATSAKINVQRPQGDLIDRSDARACTSPAPYVGSARASGGPEKRMLRCVVRTEGWVAFAGHSSVIKGQWNGNEVREPHRHCQRRRRCLCTASALPQPVAMADYIPLLQLLLLACMQVWTCILIHN